MILFRIIGLSLAKAKQAVCIRAAWLSRQLVSRDRLSMTVVAKNSTLDSSLGIPGSWTLLDSSVCCIPDSIGENYPGIRTPLHGAHHLRNQKNLRSEIFLRSAVRELFVSLLCKRLMTTHKWKFHSYLNADNVIAKNNRLD